MQLRAHVGPLLALIAAAAGWPAACAPDSGLLPASATTGGVGGVGGSPFEPAMCDDPTDGDGDGIADAIEGAEDTDRDGTPDRSDTDSDGDGVADAEEAQNPLLGSGAPGQARGGPCDALADTDGDGTPDVRDLDSDNDGVPDRQEASSDPSGRCRVVVDCDGDGVLDLIELAAGSDPTDGASVPDDPGLYFVLPYRGGEQTKEFSFSTAINRADIYFLIDTTESMAGAIGQLKSSLSDRIIPAILNGDPAASPPIPPIGDAWIGIGDFRDVPKAPYGQPGDEASRDPIYRNRFAIAGQPVRGDVAPPRASGTSFAAPANVAAILDALAASGGGDGPEATTQALWIAATNQPYAATNVDPVWRPASPYPTSCPEPGMFGVPCFRPRSLPIFVVVSDAPFHNGPAALNAYDPANVGGTRSYDDAVAALNAVHAKVVGVPVATGSPGAARLDLTDLAGRTGSRYHDPAFGGSERPLVPQADVLSTQVSSEVVRLIGLLAGAGLHDVTTARASYDCPGGADCTGDGAPDLEYHNPVIDPAATPFDAAPLITAIEPLPSAVEPRPYSSVDGTTFHDVPGNATVTFRVRATNDVLRPASLVVLRAIIRVVTPSGQLLGGASGIKLVYFVIPEVLSVPE